jgi:Zn-dependent M28 family amino/carboxypeptidase
MKAAGQQVGILLDDRYQQPVSPNRWLSGSDCYPFYQKGISVLQLGSGYPVSYHQLTDTPDKIDFALLALQTRQAFLTLWNMANQ